MLTDFHDDFYDRDSFDEMIKMRGQQPYANFKTACFVKYLGSILMDFHKTSLPEILLMR